MTATVCSCGHQHDRHVGGTICMADCPCVLFDDGKGTWETSSRRLLGDQLHDELAGHQRALRDHVEEQLSWQTARLQADVQVREAIALAVNIGSVVAVGYVLVVAGRGVLRGLGVL